MATVNALHSDHTRIFSLGDQLFQAVYPVLSRRAGGLSVGVNLNLDKACNFDCIYCQVDRTTPPLPLPPTTRSEADLILDELRRFFEAVDSGRFFRDSVFGGLSKEHGQIRDIAFSGDGEPTLSSSFKTVAASVRAFLSERSLTEGPPPLLRLITNGSGLFSRDTRLFIRRVFLEDGPGEIWLKLDAADPESYARIDRSPIPFERLMEGLDQVVADLPVTIQTMLLDFKDPGDPGAFKADRALFDPMLEKVAGWIRSGAAISAWHLYSVARPPAVSAVRRVSQERLDAFARQASAHLSIPVQVFP